MKVFKGLALGLTGFILFTALLILGMAVTVNSTVLNPQFVITEIEKLDINAATQQILSNNLSSDAQNYIPAVDATLKENKAWINEQIDYSVNSFYDYLFGKTDTLDITVSLESIKPSLARNLKQVYTQTSAANGLTAEQIQQQIMSGIPSEITLNPDVIPQDVWQTIQTAKDIVGYTRIAYFSLIALSILLVLAIVLILREVKGTALSLGIIFLIVGALNLIAFIITQQFIPWSIPLSDLPSSLRIWLTQVINDYFSPWKIYSIVLLVLGILLLVVSFFFHGKEDKRLPPPEVSN